MQEELKEAENDLSHKEAEMAKLQAVEQQKAAQFDPQPQSYEGGTDSASSDAAAGPAPLRDEL